MSTNITATSVETATAKARTLIDEAKNAGMLDIDEALLLIAAVCLLEQNPMPAVRYLLQMDAKLSVENIITSYTKAGARGADNANT